MTTSPDEPDPAEPQEQAGGPGVPDDPTLQPGDAAMPHDPDHADGSQDFVDPDGTPKPGAAAG